MLFLRQHGFTLIELMVLLTIIVILALASVPLFLGNANYRRITLTADELSTALRYARSEAIKLNNNVYVSFNVGDSWCYGINAGSVCNCLTPTTCNLKTVTYSKTQQINLSTTFASNNFYFEGSHGSASNNGTVTLTLYGDTPFIRMTLTRLGNLQICSTGISGYSAC